jgi:hypothetical protein
VYLHPQFLLIGRHNIGCNCKLINFNQYNSGSIFFVAMYCFVPPFLEAKFCVVPSGAIVKVGCVVCKNSLRNNILSMEACLELEVKFHGLLTLVVDSDVCFRSSLHVETAIKFA